METGVLQLQLWNSLPAELRQADISFQRFKRLLKTFLFGCWDSGTLWLNLLNCTSWVYYQGLKWAGSHRISDPAACCLPGLCRVS